MRLLILSDLHANGDALRAVLDAADPTRFDRVVVLGDFVGYGPEPNRVIATIAEIPVPVSMVRGNHDRVACGLSSVGGFNPGAAAAVRWTRDRLTDSSIAFLRELPTGPRDLGSGVAICHGSPVHEDDYILDAASALEAFAESAASVVFFGHSHLASRFENDGGAVDFGLLPGEGESRLDPARRYLLNPGSVGQPRDKDPRAAYMTYDTESRRLGWHRAVYPATETVRKMRDRGLPDALAGRLLLGE